MTQDKDQMRAEFEDAFCHQFKLSGTVSHCWNAKEEQYSNGHLQAHWLTWQAALASESERTEPPTHAMYRRVFRHGAVRDWEMCSIEYANYILSNPERFGETEVKFLKEV